ncbi:MAG TPA: hypothetical protein VFQ53_23575 [Kofleriaceae bacterium]|nr:hypothetical protein [Kofleriaceae bacterium]
MRVAIVAWLVCMLATSRADAEPSDRTLVYTGLVLAPPTYLVGVTLHEGSHAVMGKLVGAEILDFHVFPPGRDPKGIWRFGWTYVRGLETKTERVLFYVAPKITDALLLGGFAGLVLTDAWPSNRYGELALTVFATGLWVDFSKDVLAFRKSNDVVKVFDQWCMHGWKQVPARLVYAGMIVGLGFVVARGYQRTFGEDTQSVATARVVPIVGGAF